MELVARAAGVGLHVDEELEAEIERFSRASRSGCGGRTPTSSTGVRKQATIPDGAESLGLAGTAPGLVLQTDRAAVVILPGPPAELQRLWPRALETEPVRRVLARTQPPEHRILRFFGASESEVARALAEAGGEPEGVEATICARDFEIHVDLFGPADELASALRERLERHLFAEDERGVEELVLDLCRARGWTLATAESCTGGMVATRLTSGAGSSDVFVGAVVAYSNDVKEQELGVVRGHARPLRSRLGRGRSGDGLRRQGSGSARTWPSPVTGIAGPGGGTPEKPVGTVFPDTALWNR